MNNEQFKQLKKNNSKTLEKLIDDNIKTSWFISYHATDSVKKSRTIAYKSMDTDD